MHLSIVAVGSRRNVQPCTGSAIFTDQPFWGSRVRQLGCGPPPTPSTWLNTANLADGIDKSLNDAEIIQKSQLMGQTLRREYGAEKVVRIIRSVLEKNQS